ncbi:MAG: diguanylate cyclase [Deltaproteobacteria bacterium]|nr:diguanylate cyclase [Deltaproteobacteria bacterium]MBN2672065.1 diguanylate cyclase [Deltaproteobacteria bacterium]
MSEKKRCLNFTKEQKDDAVRRVRAGGQSIPAVARNLGVSEQSLRRWLKEANSDEESEFDSAMTTDQLEELQRLRVQQFSMFNSLMNGFPDTTCYVKDVNGVFIDCNQAYLEKTLEGALTRETLLNGKTTDFTLGFPKDDCELYARQEKQVIENGVPITNRYPVHNKTGKLIRWEKTTKIPFRDSTGAVIGTIGISTDISELIQTQEELKISIELARILTNNSTEGILVLRGNKIFLSNPYAAQLLGYSAPDDLEGMNVNEFLLTGQLDMITAKLANNYTDFEELKFRTNTGEEITLAVQGKISPEAQGLIFNLRKPQEQTDSLTGLILKRAFTDALAGEMEKPADAHIAIGFIDVNNLKFVNDTCKEHTKGDSLIKSVAEIVKSGIRAEKDVFARLYQGGDEFCLMFPSLPADGEKTFEIINSKVTHLVQQLRGKTIVLDNQIEVPINISIGVTIYRRSSRNPGAEALLAEADALMYVAKKEAEEMQNAQNFQWKPTKFKIIFSKFNNN